MKFLAFVALALAAKVENHQARHEFLKSNAEAGQTCEDADSYWGTTDTYGDGCDWYYGNEWGCGLYDHSDGNGFYANWDCCACGGGW